MDFRRIEWISSSSDETVLLGKKLASLCQPGSVLLLYGDVGAGKTHLVKGIVSYCTGIDPEVVSSPTFVLMQMYEGQIPVFHFDLYRLTKPQEFLEMGFQEYWFQGGLACIEWPERLGAFLPESFVRVEMNVIDEESRSLVVEINTPLGQQECSEC